MGKYWASPWGFIRGKLGDSVGGYWKGIEWVRIRIFPTQRGTLDLYKQLKAGLINPNRFSYKQMNIRRLVFQVLGYIGRNNLSTLIYPVWEQLRKKRKLALTGINLFTARSTPDMWASIPNPDQEFDAVTNCPDMTEMKLSDGDLEPANFIAGPTAFEYDPVTGNCIFRWDTGTIKNGKADDYVYTMVYVKPIIDSQWRPDGYLYGRADIVPLSVRADGTVTITIPSGFAKTDVYGYVFCRDNAGEIGFSPSDSRIAS